MGPEQQIQQLPTNPVEEEDPDPDLVADEPPFSSSSEDSIPVFRRTGTQDSGFNPISEDSANEMSQTTITSFGLKTDQTQRTLNYRQLQQKKQQQHTLHSQQ